MSRQSEKLPANGLLLDIRPSGKLLIIYCVFVLSLLSAVLILQVPVIYKLVLLIICICFSIKILRQHLLFTHPLSIHRLLITELDFCFAQLNNGQIKKLSILAQSCLIDKLVVLSMGHEKMGMQWQTCSLLVNADMVGSERFRQLKRQLIINHRSRTEKDTTKPES